MTNQVLNGSLKACKSPYFKFFNEDLSNIDENVWVSPLHTELKILIFMFFLVCNQAFWTSFYAFQFKSGRDILLFNTKFGKITLMVLIRVEFGL